MILKDFDLFMGRRKHRTERVTIGLKNVVRLSPALTKRIGIGKNHYVLFYYNRKGNEIALKFVINKQPFSYRATTNKDAARISCDWLFKEHKLSTSGVKEFKYYENEQVLIINLDET